MNKEPKLTQRKAVLSDLPNIVHLLSDDELGQTREAARGEISETYIEAFAKIDADPNQYLMVVLLQNIIVGTCHLTIMPSLTYQGLTRMQIEAVRISKEYRGQKIGEWMMQQAFQFAKEHDVRMVQLTTNKLRPKAIKFYEQLGFTATHEGMKYFVC